MIATCPFIFSGIVGVVLECFYFSKFVLFISFLCLDVFFFFPQVTGRDGKPLPPWIVYDATSQTVRGQPASSDAGDWAVRVDGPAREVFTIRVRRQVMDDDDANEGSGSLIDDYSESDDVESDVNEEIVSPDNRVVISPTTPLFNVFPYHFLYGQLLCLNPFYFLGSFRFSYPCDGTHS